MQFSPADEKFMQRAIDLAALGRYTTSPNPNVGAVIVLDGQIVGEGYHQQAGGPHAEVFALRQAGAQARGATCYVTLEPCSHFGRTPPCALALIDAGVGRVVIAMQDPNPQVSGRGVKLLQDAGISVDIGCLTAKARALNPGFLHRMQQQRPFVRLKLAASVDGAIALGNGQSQWLTGPAAREDVQLWRAQSCAILSTARTVLADAAVLNVRSSQVTALNDGQIRQPLRVILDRQQLLKGDEALFQAGGDILLIRPPQSAASSQALPTQPERQIFLAEVALTAQHKFDLPALLDLLASKNINLLWVEAGSTLAAEFWQLKLVDELVLYQAPMLLGQGALPMLPIAAMSKLTQAPRWQWQDVCTVGDDVRLVARIKGEQ